MPLSRTPSPADYVVIQVWARRGANVYLLDQVRKRLSFTDTLTAFLAVVAMLAAGEQASYRGQGQRDRGHRSA